MKTFRNLGGRVEECDLLEGARWFTPESVRVLFEEPGGRLVARTELSNGTVISTVFLVFDHGFGGPTPLIFETMVFDQDWEDLTTIRYSTVEEAREGHAAAVREFRPLSKAESAGG